MGVTDSAKKAGGVVREVAVEAPKSAVVGFWRGLTYPFKGMRFVFFQHPELIRIWIFPIVITFLVLGLVFQGVWDYHAAFVELFWEEPTGEGFWVGVAQFFHGFVEILVAILGFLLGLVVVYFLSAIFAAPFNDTLSEEVENLYLGRESPASSLWRMVLIGLRDTVRTVGLETVKLLIYGLVMVPLFVASLLIPVAGQIAYTVFGYLFTAMYWSIDYVDWPASRQNRGIRYRFGMLFEHFLPMLGFGCGVWLFLLIPFVNLFLMPAAVAGGTLLYWDLERERDQERASPEPV